MKKTTQRLMLFMLTAGLVFSSFTGCNGGGNETGEKQNTNKELPNYTESRSFRILADRPCTPTEENLIVYKEAGFTHYNMTEDDYKITNVDGQFGYVADDPETTDKKETSVSLGEDENGNVVHLNENDQPIDWNENYGADDGILNPKYLEAFDTCEKVGLKAIIRNYYACSKYFKNDTEETRARDITLPNVTYRIPVRDLAEGLSQLPALDGYYMGDEPSWAFIDTLAPIVDWYNENAYGKGKNGDVSWFHINLLQTYGNGFFAGHTYEEYVDKYCDVILSKVKGSKSLGTDYYPLEYDAKTGDPYIKNGILTDYFVIAEKTKQMNAAIADEKDKVLTNFCIQTFNSQNTKWRDISSLADITFQTNLAMAFGAKSLQYYLYRASSGSAGIIDNVKQQPTYMYPFVKEANRQVKNLQNVILSFDWVSAKTYKGVQVSSEVTAEGFDKVAARTAENFAFVSNVSSRLDTVISEMQDKSGNKGYMVVNFSEPSLGQTDFVTLSFIEGVKKAVVYIEGEPQTVDVVNGKLNLKLGAGGGAFVYPVQ